MVMAVRKKEHFIATGKPQILKSSVEEGFGLEIPDKSLMAGSSVVFRVNVFLLIFKNHTKTHSK